MGATEDINSEKHPCREFQVFVKPAGPACNLSCSYCYYINKAKIFEAGRPHLMNDELLELYIRQHIEASTEPAITFSWHGGEPLLAGIDFYRKALSLQRKYCPPGRKILNGVQTNGTLIDENWCRFLAEEDFLIGISLDGPQELHDIFRKTKDGQGTFAKVLHGYDMLVMHGIDPEILSVVNAKNVEYPGEVYRFFRHLGASYITFIPLVEPLAGKDAVSERTAPSEAFGKFLCAIFDEWVTQDIGKIKVQIFEEALRTSFKQEHTLCIFKPVCGGVPVVEHNGDFFMCDHFVNPDHLLGNIRDNSLAEMLDSRKQKAFGQAKRNRLPDYCRKCNVRDMCNGECPKNRFLSSPDGEPGLNYLCKGYRMFFNHCRPFAEEVANVYINETPNKEHRF
jgi:uncharacterized protein